MGNTSKNLRQDAGFYEFIARLCTGAPSIGIIVVNLDSLSLVFANSVAARMLEAESVEELLKHSMYDLVVPERRRLLDLRIAQMKDGQIFHNLETPVRTIKGNHIWIRGDYLPFEYNEQKYVLVAGVQIDRDIALREEFQKRLVYEKALGDLYSSIAQSFELNSALERFLPLLRNRLGADRAAAFKRSQPDEQFVRIIAVPDEQPPLNLSTSLLTEAVVNGGIVRRQNLTLLVLATGHTPRLIVALENAKLQGFDEFLEDLRRYLELWMRALTLNEELETSHSQFLKLLDLLPNAVIVIDTNRKIVFWNHTAEEMFNLSADKAVGKDALSLFSSEYAQRRAKAALQKLETGEPLLNRIWDVFIPGKGMRYYRLFAVPLRGMSPFAAVVIISDDTERRKLEVKLEEEGRLTALGELAAGVAHEINNPLQGIVSIAELLKHRLENSGQAELVKFADVVLRESSRIGKIVENLLQLGNPQTGEFTEYDLNQIVREAVELMQGSFDSNGIRLETELDPSLPPIVGFKHATFQILLNLLANARNAVLETEASERIVRIRTRHREDDSNVPIELSVEDSGPGVDESLKERIFDPFFTTRRPQGGSGLGLSISLRLARQQGGDILIARSEELGGAKFSLLLPLESPRFDGR